MAERLEELKDLVSFGDDDLPRLFRFQVQEVRDSGAGQGIYTVKGLASVYDQWSLDLGGFRERVAPGAFDAVLATDPHVLHVWDHDTSKPLSSTRSKDYPLELRSSKDGLEFFSRVAPTSYAMDLRTLLEGGVVDQSSFAFTVKSDEWRFVDDGDGDESIERTILEVDSLYDVTTCAMGAYPQTSSMLAVRSLLARKPEPRATLTFPLSNTASSTTGVYFSGTDLRRQDSGAQPEPAPEPEPDAPTGVEPAEPAAPEQVAGDKPADAPQKPEDAEAAQRAHELWKAKYAGQHRRTREFAFGVKHEQGDD